MKYRINILSLYTALLFAVTLAGCSEAPFNEEGGTPEYRTVTVTLPPLVQDSAGQEPLTTRTSHPDYTNVWLLQFDADGNKLQSTNLGTIAADANITATVAVAENCTFYVVTNGPETGLAPATLTAFEAMNIAPADETQPCCTASLYNISVEEYNGVARVISAGGEPVTFLLRSATPTLSAFAGIFIPGWSITGMELYNVPKNSPYKGGTTSPNPTADAGNFDYTDLTAKGKPLSYTTDANGTVSGTWYIPANLQGSKETITNESDRNHANAPQFATFIRVRAANSTTGSTASFDVYPGEGVTGFDLQRNHAYALFIAIDGTEDDLNKTKTDVI